LQIKAFIALPRKKANFNTYINQWLGAAMALRAMLQTWCWQVVSGQRICA
jgi:hypothetical protein